MNHPTQQAPLQQVPVPQATSEGGAAGALRVLLISTYDLGRQPFSLASPAAWLLAEGAAVDTADLAAEQLSRETVRQAHLIALSVPMHTATRLALHHLPALRVANPAATICCYGLYAAMNEQALRAAGADHVLAGEFEEGLAQLARRVKARRAGVPAAGPPPASVSTARQRFLLPDRTGLPPLDSYARLVTAEGERLVGATEATRGCKHMCRHCPIVPVYQGKFRVVQRDVVLADIRQQVRAGATHITFGDPDFFNGPAHSIAIVRALHEEFPSLTYDVTIKVEHLVKHRHLVPVLKQTGCLFVTSAVEAFDAQTLDALEKHHTMAEFVSVVGHFGQIGLHLSPTFVPFTPWTTPQTYRDLLTTIAELGLADSVAPVQYAIRLLIPAGSRILELPLAQACIGEFDPGSLAYPWQHPDPGVDLLHTQVLDVVDRAAAAGTDRRDVFGQVWAVATAAAGDAATPVPPLPPRAGTIPHLTEPWYCCAEPTERQLAQSLHADGGPAPDLLPLMAEPLAPAAETVPAGAQAPAPASGCAPAPAGGPGDELAQRARRAAFFRILDGHPATVEHLAQSLGVSQADADATVQALVAAHRARTGPDGAVAGAAGLSLLQTPHRLVIRDRAPLWCWCAWDTVGISSALGLTAVITTPCGRCGRELTVRAEAGVISGDEAIHGYLPMPTGSPLSCFCPYALMFCSAEHLSSWRATLPDGPAAQGHGMPLATFASQASGGWCAWAPPAGA